jgi:hypothetical protein
VSTHSPSEEGKLRAVKCLDFVLLQSFSPDVFLFMTLPDVSSQIIIDLMNELALSSLLRRGTKTWHGGDYETTIDLVLASEELTDSVVKCAIHGTEHGSDHRAIETVFDMSVPVPKHQERLLLKNAPWKEINARIARTLEATLSEGAVQQKTDRLMLAVLEAVHALTPKAKPSPYAKRSWIPDHVMY